MRESALKECNTCKTRAVVKLEALGTRLFPSPRVLEPTGVSSSAGTGHARGTANLERRTQHTFQLFSFD